MSDDHHIWNEFLEARAKAIVWMNKHHGDSDRKIANVLSMDEEQVRLIRVYQTNLEKAND